MTGLQVPHAAKRILADRIASMGLGYHPEFDRLSDALAALTLASQESGK